MKRKWAYYASKFTLLDEILGLVYWALAIYGIFVIVGKFNGAVMAGVALSVYIVVVVFLYISVLKKVSAFFKDNAE